MKFLIWLVIGLAVVTWIRRATSAFSKTQRDLHQGSRHDFRQNTSGKAEEMLQCAHCGVHIPASEALIGEAGLVFCCEEHRAQRDAR
ncbi:MAG: PP0621 family protein [Burkholderiales bacterium]